MTLKFPDLGIKPELVTALEKKLIKTPSEIQIAAIPQLLDRKDAYLQAQTGTGKTLAYLLPLFSRIDPSLPNAQLIVIAPTHELALQIQRQCTDLSQLSGLPIRVLLLIGGTSMDRQLEKLKKKPHVIVGSLGRIKELIDMRKLKSQMVRTIVIDEADRMLVPDSRSDIESIINSCAKDRNLIFVSATELPGTIKAVTALAPDFIKIQTSEKLVTSKINHLYLICNEEYKADCVRDIVLGMESGSTIVFTHKNQDAEDVAKALKDQDLEVMELHGELNKIDRKDAMDSLRAGKVQVLVSSDVAARGLDIKGVTHVINYDMPSDSSAYLHRVGRTGRAGERGTAISLIGEDQEYLIERYIKDLGINMTEVQLQNGELLEVYSEGE